MSKKFLLANGEEINLQVYRCCSQPLMSTNSDKRHMWEFYDFIWRMRPKKVTVHVLPKRRRLHHPSSCDLEPVNKSPYLIEDNDVEEIFSSMNRKSPKKDEPLQGQIKEELEKEKQEMTKKEVVIVESVPSLEKEEDVNMKHQLLNEQKHKKTEKVGKDSVVKAAELQEYNDRSKVSEERKPLEEPILRLVEYPDSPPPALSPPPSVCSLISDFDHLGDLNINSVGEVLGPSVWTLSPYPEKYDASIKEVIEEEKVGVKEFNEAESDVKPKEQEIIVAEKKSLEQQLPTVLGWTPSPSQAHIPIHKLQRGKGFLPDCVTQALFNYQKNKEKKNERFLKMVHEFVDKAMKTEFPNTASEPRLPQMLLDNIGKVFGGLTGDASVKGFDESLKFETKPVDQQLELDLKRPIPWQTSVKPSIPAFMPIYTQFHYNQTSFYENNNLEKYQNDVEPRYNPQIRPFDAFEPSFGMKRKHC